MPGLYAGGEFDLAGFSVGAVERHDLLPRRDSGVAEGDVVLALVSSGVHSNGYSLVRKVVEVSGTALSAPAPFDPGVSLAAALLEPTRIYVAPCLSAARTNKITAYAIGRASGRERVCQYV